MEALLPDEVEEKDKIDRGKGEEEKAKTVEGWVEVMGHMALVVPLLPAAWVSWGLSCCLCKALSA